MRSAHTCLLLAAIVGCAAAARGQSSLAGTTYHMTRATAPIRVDGDLSDEAWRSATRIDTWYEVQPGDNGVPPVKSVGYLTYDDRFLYAAFEFEDPNPQAIRAPLGDHDAINGNSMDFGGIFLDALNTGRTAYEFFVTPRNVQYDAIDDDASGENSSPDFFWDSAARITDRGWVVEMRIPFSTLRYRNLDPQTWGIILFRNYPRQYRYQLMSTRVPRGNNCLICHENLVAGLEGLPTGGHLIAAPYVSASETAHPAGNVLGSPLVTAPTAPHAGIDVKFTPNANNAIDFTVKPDFSQVESDTAQISANERFALFFPEKRPFFLEGVDLLQTPIQAVYTRTITAPTWGTRVTGKEGGIRYTALVTEDAGGGSAVIPGPNDSSTVPQDFASRVLVGRAKRDIGLSFYRRARDGSRSRRRRRAQPGRRSRFSVAAVGHRRRQRAVAVQRDTDARPARSRQRMERRAPEREHLPDQREPQLPTSRLVCEVQQCRQWVSRRYRLRAAGGISGGLRLHRMDRAPDRVRVDRPPVRDAGLSGGAVGGGDHARRRAGHRPEHPMERLHAVPLHRQPDAGGRRADRAQTVRLLRAVQPVAALQRGRPQRHARAGHRLRERAAWPRF